jgi:divalent metal cation (Fe/Co/Zn/Cd) transporter
VDEVRVRDHGQYVIVDAKIGVDANLTVAQGHQIADRVKHDMIENFDRVQDVLVHVNPHFQSEPEEEGR